MAATPRQRDAFPSTRWSRILSPGGGRDLDALARAYERPVAAFLRAKLRCDEHDLADRTQEAFAWMLAGGLFDKADPARGRFRGFLKKALANFTIELARREAAAKRGGQVSQHALDAVAELVDDRSPSPEQALDEAWRRALLADARDRLEAELQRNGRGAYWRLFDDYFLADGEQPTHAQLAERHGVTRNDVSNWLDYGKRRYRALLREIVTETVATPEELEQELRWLFGADHDA